MSAEALLDVLTAHRIGLERLSTGVLKDLLDHLVVVEDDIEAQIRKRLKNAGPGEIDPTSERLTGLLGRIRKAQTEAAKAVTGDLQKALLATAAHESGFTADAYGRALKVNASLEQLGAEQLEAIITSKPMQGRWLKDWFSSFERGTVDRIEQQILIGMTEGEGVDQIVRRLRGTKAEGYRDGVYQTNRRSAETVTRTAMNHVSNQAHVLTLEKNAHLFPKYQWISVLDRKTSPICRHRAGKTFETGKGPIPPAHPNCRSTVIAIPKGMPDDMFGDVSYESWLKKQPADVVEDILGPTRAQLWSKGKLPLNGFTNRDGEQIRLDRLREIEADAWARAGLGEPYGGRVLPPPVERPPEPPPPWPGRQPQRAPSKPTPAASKGPSAAEMLGMKSKRLADRGSLPPGIPQSTTIRSGKAASWQAFDNWDDRFDEERFDEMLAASVEQRTNLMRIMSKGADQDIQRALAPDFPLTPEATTWFGRADEVTGRYLMDAKVGDRLSPDQLPQAGVEASPGPGFIKFEVLVPPKSRVWTGAPNAPVTLNTLPGAAYEVGKVVKGADGIPTLQLVLVDDGTEYAKGFLARSAKIKAELDRTFDGHPATLTPAKLKSLLGEFADKVGSTATPQDQVALYKRLAEAAGVDVRGYRRVPQSQFEGAGHIIARLPGSAYTTDLPQGSIDAFSRSGLLHVGPPRQKEKLSASFSFFDMTARGKAEVTIRGRLDGGSRVASKAALQAKYRGVLDKIIGELPVAVGKEQAFRDLVNSDAVLAALEGVDVLEDLGTYRVFNPKAVGFEIPEFEAYLKQTVWSSTKGLDKKLPIPVNTPAFWQMARRADDRDWIADEKMFKRITEQLPELSKAIADSKVAARMPPGALEAILKEGRIKNVYDSGKSKGGDKDRRKYFEDFYFGSKDYSNRQRAIYGYLANKDNILSRSAYDSDLDGYGSVAVILRDSVKPRATFTVGDSLTGNQEGVKVVPSPLLKPDPRSFLTTRNPRWEGVEGLSDKYVETQIWGGVTADDIEAVVSIKPLPKPVLEELKKRGIKVVIEGKPSS